MSLENQKLPGAAIEANSISELELSSNLLSLIQSGGGPKVISYSFSSGNTLNDIGGDTVTLTGSNFDSNITVSVDGNSISNVTVTNSSSLTFTTEQFSNAGNFLIFLRNPDGSSTVAVPEIEVIQYVYTFQGTVSGYSSGGTVPPAVDTIDKFPFATDGNATDVGDLTQARYFRPTGHSSTVSGYTVGGLRSTPPPPPTLSDRVDKFPFASDANATDTGDLTYANYQASGHNSEISGYISGGELYSFNSIDKFPFAADSSTTFVGNLYRAKRQSCGQSSPENGYISGGFLGPPLSTPTNDIEKFSFASDENATDVGNLSQARTTPAGQNSTDNGYTSGGTPSPFPAVIGIIDKFPFASDANATDVGYLTSGRSAIGQSSTVSGYTSGGGNVIDKFPFASNANATDVGDLTQSRGSLAGQQV